MSKLQAPSPEISEKLIVAPAPHLKHPDTTRSIMVDVLIALLPALVWAVYLFGARALLLSFLSVGACMGFEALFQAARRQPITITDGSAAVTGLLLAFNLPVTVPLWVPVLGGLFAIVLVKQLYGGIGKNIVNPALAARVFLFLSFPRMLATFAQPHSEIPVFTFGEADAVTSATPLAALKVGELPATTLSDAFFGLCGGSMGEVSTLLLLVGGLYLLWRRVITWHIPVSYLATVALFAGIAPQAGDRLTYLGYALCTGGLMLGALFMATDYATSPISPRGRLIYGVGCGLLTVLLRYFGAYAEGVSFAILIMNLLVWYIDRFTKPMRFGGKTFRDRS